tara:strand:- start:53 stop:751 length:699 start_codon:yes stop_codon:yes gene_type:complete
MVLSILQPSFIPWIGYFSIIKKSDFVVFLDHVQFNKRSWQQRNYIKTKNGPIFLTIPVLTKNKFSQKISEVQINNEENYIKKHLKSIHQNYYKTKYFEKYFEKIKSVYEKKEKFLINLNINFISMILEEILNKKFKFQLSSNLNINSKKNNLIIDICKYYKTNKYLSARGADVYLEDEIFKKENIELIFSDFKHPIYDQINGKFLANLSIIDLLFNCGEESKLIIEKSISKI